MGLTQKILAAFFLTTAGSAAHANQEALVPVIERVTPTVISAGGLLDVDFRDVDSHKLGRDPGAALVSLRKDDALVKLRWQHYRGVAADDFFGGQTLTVSLPPDIERGVWWLTIEFEGRRSDAVGVSVQEWIAPRLRDLSATVVQPGDRLIVLGEHFHDRDVVELTDAAGTVHLQHWTPSPSFTSFEVPEGVPDGAVSVRVGQIRGDHSYFSEPLKFEVTASALPAVRFGEGMRPIAPVAPGQWVTLGVEEWGPLSRADRAEIEFVQGGVTKIVDVVDVTSRRPCVWVPPDFSAGPITLRNRTWRYGQSSPWSPPTEHRLLEQPSVPQIDVIDFQPFRPSVSLVKRQGGLTMIDTEPGDRLTLRGHLPVGVASDLWVKLHFQSLEISLTPFDGEDGVAVVVPQNLASGLWTMTIGCALHGTEAQVPIQLRIR